MATLVAPLAPRTVLPDTPNTPLDPPMGSVRRAPSPAAARVAPETDRRPQVVLLAAPGPRRTAQAEALAAAGLRVVIVGTIQAALTTVGPSVSCLVLDRRAPDGDALALVDRLYRGDRPPRMVVVTSEESDRERVESLVAGADDVVPPHVSAGELVVRVRRLVTTHAVTERHRHLIAVGRVSIDQDRRCVQVDGSDVALSPTQYQILVSLAVEGGKTVTVRALVERCWDAHQDRSSCAVRTQVTRLRRALLGAVDIRSIRGQGYRLAVAEG